MYSFNLFLAIYYHSFILIALMNQKVKKFDEIVRFEAHLCLEIDWSEEEGSYDRLYGDNCLVLDGLSE